MFLAPSLVGTGTSTHPKAWLDLLTTTTTPEQKTAMKYSINILHSLNIGYRTYIWKGGTYPTTNPDGSPSTDPRAGQDWCFAYGEKEWMGGKKWLDALRDAGANKPGARLNSCP